MIVVMSIVFASQSSFNKSLILANTAYDIALTLRSAETYGLNSRAVGTISNVGYGVHFQRGIPGAFTLFADTSPNPDASNCHGLPVGGENAPDAQFGNCVYTLDQDQKVKDYTLGNNITISDFCALAPSGSWSCAYANGGALSSLDIVFTRPNPDAFISENALYSKLFPRTSACLAVTSPQGGTRFVSVAASGAITANALSCP